MREETRCRHMGYSFRLAARVLLYASSHRQDISHTMAFVTPVVEHWLEREIAQWVHPMKDRSDDPSHHERMLLPWSCILAPLCKENNSVSNYAVKKSPIYACQKKLTEWVEYIERFLYYNDETDRQRVKHD